MSEPQKQKTLKVYIGKVLHSGASGYMVASRHPMDVGPDGTAIGPAPSTPGVLIPYLRPAEVPVFDERHEAMLRQDAVLKNAIVSDEKYAELMARAAQGEGNGSDVSPKSTDAALLQKLATLQSDLEAAGAHYASLEAEAEARTKALAAEKAKVAELEAELAASRKQVDELTKPPPPVVAPAASQAPAQQAQAKKK